MPTFDADHETPEAPEMILGGVSYRGRILSITEWFGFKERLEQQLKQEEADGTALKPETLEAAQTLRVEFLRRVFPAGERDPIGEIEQRGPLAIAKAFSAFFSHMRHAFGAVPPQTTETDGTSSPDRTTNGPSANANA